MPAFLLKIAKPLRHTSPNTGYTAQPLCGFAQISPYGQTSYSPKTVDIVESIVKVSFEVKF